MSQVFIFLSTEFENKVVKTNPAKKQKERKRVFFDFYSQLTREQHEVSKKLLKRHLCQYVDNIE